MVVFSISYVVESALMKFHFVIWPRDATEDTAPLSICVLHVHIIIHVAFFLIYGLIVYSSDTTGARFRFVTTGVRYILLFYSENEINVRIKNTALCRYCRPIRLG